MTDENLVIDDDLLECFMDEESLAMAETSQRYQEYAETERKGYEAIIEKMRGAGFLRIDDVLLDLAPIPERLRHPLCFSRNGLMIAYGSEWSVFAQTTGELIATLPDDIPTVIEFVNNAERMTYWPGQTSKTLPETIRRAAELVEQTIQAQLDETTSRAQSLIRWRSDRTIATA